MIVLKGVTPEEFKKAMDEIPSGLVTHDHGDELEKSLDEETLEAINKVRYTKLENEGTGIRYVAHKCNSKDDIEEGIKSLAKSLNNHHKKYNIIGHLAKCIGFDLYGGAYVLASYVGYPEDRLKEIDNIIEEKSLGGK